MISFPKDFPEKLRSAILPSEVIAKKVKLKSRGKDFLGLCPFHNEKTPSFTVNDQKGFYHCFGCQAHGDIVSFTMESEGLSFVEAVKKLAYDFNIQIPKPQIDEKVQKIEDRKYLILEKICEIFEKNLNEDFANEARKYLSFRGLNSKIAKKFRLGFSPNSYDFLHKKLFALGFNENEILTSGIIGKNEQGKIYDKFRNRIIFPILNRQNQPIAFGGRVLSDDLPKYLNSSETEIFKKNQTLYNLSGARKSIFDKKYAILVEGYMDVISLSANGIENAVAGLGTALSQNHLEELFKITDKIILCLDGDSAGIKAAKRASEIALSIINAKKNIAFVFLPNQLDPDDFIKKYGAKALENLIKTENIELSQALFDFALMELNLDKKSAISPEEKAKLEIILQKKSDLIKDATIKKYFSQFFKDILFNFGRNFKKSAKTGKNNEKNPQNHTKIGNLIKKSHIQNDDFSDNFAKNIIVFLIKYPNLKDYSDENFDIKEVNFANEKLTEIKDKIIDIFEEDFEIKTEKMLEILENCGYNAYIKDIKNLISLTFDNFEFLNFEEIKKKMRFLLLKELLLQVDLQYKQALQRVDEIDTHQTEIINEKIKEIFAYKNKLEHLIIDIEKET